MARQGFVVLFIDDPRTGKRQAPYAGLYATASAVGIQGAGIQVFDALRGLGLWEWYRALPDGLDTVLQAGGQSLSAGEAQLLAFARALADEERGLGGQFAIAGGLSPLETRDLNNECRL